MIRSGLIFLVVCLCAFYVNGQPLPPPRPLPKPPPPVAKPTPADKSEFTDAEMEAKILQTLAKPVSWRSTSPPGFDVRFDMPRDSVRQTESFYDEALGHTKLQMYLSVGDGATFVVGQMKLPYSITDRDVIRQMFFEVAKEVTENPALDSKAFTEFEFEGNPGMELRTPAPKPGYLGLRFRGIMMPRSMYLVLAMPVFVPGTDQPSTAAEVAVFEKDIDRFLASVKLSKTVKSSPPAPTPPEFVGSFKDGVYRSDYFKFSLTVPAGWLHLSLEDVEGIRQVGSEYIEATSDISLPKRPVRRNLASFASKALGNEGLAMISFNIVPTLTVIDGAPGLAAATEKLIASFPTYKITSKTAPVRLGGAPAQTFEYTIALKDRPQHGIVYILQRRGRVLTVTVSYYDDADRKLAVDALVNMRFESL